jgi:hypothetical protein
MMLHTPGRLAATLLLATLVVAVAAGGIAQAHSPDPVLSSNLYPQNHELKFRWHADGVPPAAMRTAALAGVEDSNLTRASKAPTFRLDPGGSSFVYYGVDAICGVNGLACFRRDTSTLSFRIYFRPNGHRFDWGVLRWCEMFDAPPDGCYDAENVMLDELGHVLVLDHHVNYKDDSDYLDAVVQTYSRTKPKKGYNAHVYGRCDVATLQRVYDVPTTSTLYSTCLDLATTLSLSASSTSVPYQGTVTFTAVLKVGSNYGRLSGNAMTGRTVVLQRRAGGSTWTDMATMTPGTGGTYTSSQLMLSTGDWRAVFRKPSNEGVRASTSGTLTVKVGACSGSLCPKSEPLGSTR